MKIKWTEKATNYPVIGRIPKCAFHVPATTVACCFSPLRTYPAPVRARHVKEEGPAEVRLFHYFRSLFDREPVLPRQRGPTQFPDHRVSRKKGRSIIGRIRDHTTAAPRPKVAKYKPPRERTRRRCTRVILPNFRATIFNVPPGTNGATSCDKFEGKKGRPIAE